MHTSLYRTNALVTYAGSLLAGIAILATLTDVFHTAHPTADVKLAHVERLQVSEGRNDEAYVACSIQADLTSTFTWNTKLLFVFVAAEYESPLNKINQISLWDKIIESQEEATFNFPFARNKYRLIDQGQNLRGKKLNLTVYWKVMPIVGKFGGGSRTFQVPFPLPDEPTARAPNIRTIN